MSIMPVKEVYKSLGDTKDYGFKDQIQRASVSVLSNIAEGFESGTRESFINYLFIAKASAGEVRAQLYVALDVGYVNIETFEYLNSLATECSKLIASFIQKLREKGMSGLQRKVIKKADPLEDILKGYGYKDGKFQKLD